MRGSCCKDAVVKACSRKVDVASVEKMSMMPGAEMWEGRRHSERRFLNSGTDLS